MAIQLPDLPYAKDALAPVISANTIEFHYGKHHRAYVDNANKLIAGTQFEKESLESLILLAVPEAGWRRRPHRGNCSED
jgi:Fe-Mn family superoxide dismutase